ncbi:hypothetical protein PINS_up013557 [Pythium insidiosum]|nr:hypothetical protein PINS_up013557 [Pythium insidiosum]
MSSAPSTFSASFPHSYLSHHQHQHQQHQHLPLRSSFFDQNPLSSSASSYTSSSTTSTTTSFAYLRGPNEGAFSSQPHHQHQHHHQHEQQQQPQQQQQHSAYESFPPLRPEDSEGYESPSPSRALRSAPHADDAKYAYSNVPHAVVGPEFTGEELSAVLELMKDS